MFQDTKRTKFVCEVDDLSNLIEEFGCLISNGDVGGVADALDNSLFERYLKENKEYQVDVWTRGKESDMFYEMLALLEKVICKDVRDSVRVRMEGEEEE